MSARLLYSLIRKEQCSHCISRSLESRRTASTNSSATRGFALRGSVSDPNRLRRLSPAKGRPLQDPCSHVGQWFVGTAQSSRDSITAWNASTALTFLDGDVTSLPQWRYHDASS